MTDIIREQYTNLIVDSADFRTFVKKMEKYSTDEIIAEYGLKKYAISCCSVP